MLFNWSGGLGSRITIGRGGDILLITRCEIWEKRDPGDVFPGWVRVVSGIDESIEKVSVYFSVFSELLVVSVAVELAAFMLSRRRPFSSASSTLTRTICPSFR